MKPHAAPLHVHPASRSSATETAVRDGTWAAHCAAKLKFTLVFPPASSALLRLSSH